MTGVEISEVDCFSADGPTDAFALQLRTGGLFVILVASAAGACLPLLSRDNHLPEVFILGQAFAGEIGTPSRCTSVRGKALS